MNEFIKKEKFIILTAVVFAVCFGFFGATKAEYYESGTLVSQNLLEDLYTESVDSFGYNATIPANTSIQVQFSQHGEYGEWYSSDGTPDGWDTLSNGDYTAEGDAIDLSTLGWTDPYFFYKASFETTDTDTTPVLDEVRVYYEEGTAPAISYETSGTLVSQNILDGVGVDNVIQSFYYNASSVPAGTSLRAQFSQDNADWYNSSGEADGWDTLVQGINSIDLSDLGWSGISFYYKIEFSSNGTATPVLDEIRVGYASALVFDHPDPLRFSRNVTFSVEWIAVLDSGVKLYVCKAEDGTSAGCGIGGSWCSNSDDFETSKIITCSYATVEGDVDINNYYIYICDSDNNCSSAIPGAFTVKTTPDSVIIKGGLKVKGGWKVKF